jgi:hypothetical protein
VLELVLQLASQEPEPARVPELEPEPAQEPELELEPQALVFQLAYTQW